MAAVESQSFAEAIEPRLGEVRRELVREVQDRLVLFERHRRAEDRGRLLQALDDLQLLVRAEYGD